jgi:hypothetical protein
MEPKTTFNNNVLIKLDPENNFIKLKNGTDLYIDTAFEPEKHATVTGEVMGLPRNLNYTGVPNVGMPWKTKMELKIGDKAICYYLSVLNALRPESMKAFIEGEDRYVFIQYQNIFAVVRQGMIIPINGYCLIEPCENPIKQELKDRMAKSNLVVVNLDKPSNTDVVFGKVKYTGRPNDEYSDGSSDEGVGINRGDMVIMRKITDLPLEYELHAKIDGGKKYWRVQRRKILAIT